jgi:uncharacterized protein YaaQ
MMGSLEIAGRPAQIGRLAVFGADERGRRAGGGRKRRRRIVLKWIALVVASATMLAAVACGGGDDKKTIDLGDGNEITVGDDLPDEWPDDFPVYDGADLQGSTRGTQDGITGVTATWTTGDSVDDVAAFYNDEFESGPWSVTLSGNAGGATYWAVENSDGSKAGYVSVTGDGGDDTIITAIVGDNPDGASGSGDSGNDDGSSSNDGSGGSSSSADLPDEVDLPDDFPTDLVSVPDGARITSGQSFSSSGQTTFMVGFITEDTVDDVGDAFEREMASKNFSQTLSSSDGNGVYAAYSENDDGTGAIIVLSVNESSSYEGYQEGVIQVTTGG